MHNVSEMQTTLKTVFNAPEVPGEQFCIEHMRENLNDAKYEASLEKGAYAQARFAGTENPAMKIQVPFSNHGWYISFPGTMIPSEGGTYPAAELACTVKSLLADSGEQYVPGHIKYLPDAGCDSCDENHQTYVFMPEDGSEEFYFYSATQLFDYMKSMGAIA